MKAFVYYNLHKECWSIRALEGAHKGRVIAHAAQVVMQHVDFRVSEAGRRRVLSTGRKNVHAGAVGDVTHIGGAVTFRLSFDGYREYGIGFQLLPGTYAGDFSKYALSVTYNPRKHTTFVSKNTGVPVGGAEMAVLTQSRQVFIRGVKHVPAHLLMLGDVA